MRKYRYNILIGIVLLMAIFQAPLIYYYTSGLTSLFFIPYILIGAALTFGLTFVLMKKKLITGIQKAGLISTIVIGSLSLFFGHILIEKIDWNLRKSTRNKIVALVKTNQLQPNSSYYKNICKLKRWNIPPISNGGNEIVIYKTEDGKFTIRFYIDRGFLDHYSAFTYTDNPADIKMFKEKTKTYKKIDTNWYRESF